MATATTEKAVYPVLSYSVWWTLRKKFQDRPPTTAVNEAYLSAVLHYKMDAAKSLIPQLVRVGLINGEGKLTERAYRWRDDKQYKAVCEEILNDVYPQALRDLYHSPDSPREDVASWFANDAKIGLGAGSNYARFYLLLLDGDPSRGEYVSESKASKSSKPANSASRGKGTKAKEAIAAPSVTLVSAPETLHEAHAQPHVSASQSHTARGFTPAIHVDFHIHIAPDATPEQIEHTFAMMAKYIMPTADEAHA